jgi:hypothetical protein
MPCRLVRNITVQPGVVILLMKVRGITMTGCTTISHASLFFFANSDNSEQRSVSIPTHGVMLSVKSSPGIVGSNHRG